MAAPDNGNGEPRATTVLIKPEDGPPVLVDVPPMPVAFGLKDGEKDPAILFKAARARKKLYRPITVLGRGSEGEVRLVECLETPDKQLAAMKIVPKADHTPAYIQLRVLSARNTAFLLGAAWRSNKHLPRLVDAFEAQNSLVAVWELLGCPLQAYVARQGGRLNEGDATKVLAGVLSAVSTLHSVDLIHRDLKPANLMLRDANDLSSVCLCDFANTVRREFILKLYQDLDSEGTVKSPAPSTGTIEVASSISSVIAEISSTTSTASTSGDSGVVVHSGSDGNLGAGSSGTGINLPKLVALVAGTPLFMSPQATAAMPPSTKDDLWSVGCIAYELLYGKSPFDGVQSIVDLTNRIVEGKINPPPAEVEVSDAAKDFIARCLSVDPTARPTADEALRHPWLVAAVSADTYHASRKPIGRPVDSEAPVPVAPAVTVEEPKPPAPRQVQELQNLLPPFTQFSGTFAGTPNHAFTVTGAEVVFDPITGELRVVSGGLNKSVKDWTANMGWNEDDDDDPDPMMSM